MKSATAVCFELDDIKAAANELTTQVKGKISLSPNTVAVLHGQPDMDIGGLAEKIGRDLSCHVIGGTTAGAAVLTNDGHHELAVGIHVMSGDDCFFATAISASLETSPKDRITKTYEDAYTALKRQNKNAEPKIIICVLSMVQSISSDEILSMLSGMSGGLPVFGYAAADDYEFCKQQVFLDGETGGDRMAVLLISGGIKPIFQVESLAGRKTIEKRVVTKAHDNVICEIDGKPAYEYIKDFPFIDDETRFLWNYQFFVEITDGADNDGVPISRALNTYNEETGEVFCFSDVPENSHISLIYCDGNDVAVSTESALQKIMGKIENADSGYEYSTILIVSCSLRRIFLADMKDTEGNLIKKIIPPDLTVSGLYAFGEIAPTSINGSKAVNRFHNATFTVCAF